MIIYLNNSFKDHQDAHISVADRGFLFGDGVYEVTRVVNGSFFMEEMHLERLGEGLRGLKIDADPEQIAAIPEISRELVKRNGLLKGEASVYLQITRGTAWPRTHVFPAPDTPPTLFLSAASFTPHSELHQSGTDAIKVPDVRWTRCNLKTVNLLPNILAKQQAREAGCENAVMVRDGVITESPNSNIFGVKGGELFTFPATNYILNGITRRVVLEIAETLSIPVRFQPLREEELFDLDELFFSGTTTDIQPVNRVDGKPIGEGKPGPIVQALQKAYRERLYG